MSKTTTQRVKDWVISGKVEDFSINQADIKEIKVEGNVVTYWVYYRGNFERRGSFELKTIDQI